MKKYYICHGDFSNVYRLMYVETKEDMEALPKNAERITRKDAIAWALDERDRRRCGVGGFADSYIAPAADYYDWTYKFQNAVGYYTIKNRIVCRIAYK